MRDMMVKKQLQFLMIRGILVILAGLGLSSPALARHKAHEAPATPDAGILSQECYAKVGPLLQSADGRLTPKVRNAYLDWAEETVLQKLRQGNQAVPESCLAEARRESEEIVNRARQGAESLLAAAAAEATKVREEQLDQARTEAARRSG